MSNYDVDMHNEWFHFHQNASYNNDRCLYQTLLSEGNNIYGTPMMYYVVSYDTTYDPLFGEDDDRRVARKFPIKAVYQLPKELEKYAEVGIEGLDMFPMYVSKKHFVEASRYDTSGVTLYPHVSGDATMMYESYTPKAGDIIRAEYTNLYYEILDIGEEEEVFLQEKHSWIFTVRRFRDEHLTLSGTTSAALSGIGELLGKDDIMDHNDYISAAEPDVTYDPSDTEEDSNQDDLDGW